MISWGYSYRSKLPGSRSPFEFVALWSSGPLSLLGPENDPVVGIFNSAIDSVLDAGIDSVL